MLGKGLCGECVHNTYVCACVYVCMCLWNTVRKHVCMYAVCLLLLLLCLHLLLCDFLVVNSCQTHKGETSLKGFVVTSTYSRAAVAASAAHSLTHTVSRCEIFRISPPPADPHSLYSVTVRPAICPSIELIKVTQFGQRHQKQRLVEIVNGNFG